MLPSEPFGKPYDEHSKDTESESNQQIGQTLIQLYDLYILAVPKGVFQIHHNEIGTGLTK